MQGEKASWLKLNMVAGLTPRKFHQLIKRFKCAVNVFEASHSELKVFLENDKLAEKISNFSAFFNLDSELEKVQKRNLEIVTLWEDDYPATLKTIVNPPPVLYIEGEIHPVDQASVAIVGSRMATSYGIAVANRIASQLAERGITVISGFALGIDTSAHQGCLASRGRTLAILGCGMARNYPASNYRLGRKVVENGALISEFPLDAEPLPYHFPRRNRIISGLSLGTLVVEAAERSGSLSTANHALEQNREVFAIPGNINSKYSQGTNNLIKAGAKLVNCCDDIIEEIEPQLKHLGIKLSIKPPTERFELSGDESLIIEMLSGNPKTIDEIIQLRGATPEKVVSLLSQMEIKGIIRQSPGKIFSIN